MRRPSKRPTPHRPTAGWPGLPGLLLLLLSATRPAPAVALDPGRPIRALARDNYRDRDGLPQNAVRDVIQLGSGLLWIGTDEGLARYDGATFTPLGHREDPGLKSDIVTALAETRDGTLWIGTNDGGLARLRAGRVEAVTIPGAPADLNVKALAADPTGGLWVATTSGVYHLEDGRARGYTMTSGLPDDRAVALAVGRDGAAWIGTRRGLVQVVGGQVRPGPAELATTSCRALQLDPAGGLWVGTQDRGAVHLGEDGLRWVGTAQGLPSATVTALLVDRDGSLWVGTQTAGLARVRGGKVERFSTQDGLASNWIATLLEDAEGSIWVGTQDAGLVRLREADFQTLGAAEGLSHDTVEAVMQDRAGDLWLATDGGVDLLKGGAPPARRVVTGLPMALHQDRSGAVWIGTIGRGLLRWRDGQATTFGQQLPTNSWVHAVQEDREGTIWVGTTDGLYRVAGDRLTPVSEGLPVERPGVVALVVTAKGELFAGLEGAGLYRRGGGRFVREEAGPPDAWTVTAFHADEDGTLWMSTEGGGLWRRRAGSYAHVSVDRGLHADSCWTILDDRLGGLWISSNRGIFRVTRSELEAVLDGQAATLHPRAWSMDDGLRGREASGSSIPGGWRAADGRLWFAMLSGVSVVDPARLRPARPPPETVLRQVSVGGRVLPAGAPVTLPPGGARLEVEYGARVLLGQRGAAFRYRLAGFDPEWLGPRRERLVQYTNLSPGSYRLEVEARVGDGAWGPTTTLRVEQPAPPWRSRLALAGAALGLAAAGAGLYLLGRRSRR